MSLVEDARDRITEMPCYIVTVPTTAPDAYVVLYPDAGISRPQRYGGMHDDHNDGFAAMAVSNTPMGAVRTLAHVRSRLTGWRPPGDSSQGPLTESSEGPLLTTRVESQTRHSLTINYSASRRRKATT